MVELLGYGVGAFSQTYVLPLTYFSNHSSSMLAFWMRWRDSFHACGSRGPAYSRVGTPLLLSARYISIDCASGTRVSLSPAKNNVGVFTFAMSLIGEFCQNA